MKNFQEDFDSFESVLDRLDKLEGVEAHDDYSKILNINLFINLEY